MKIGILILFIGLIFLSCDSKEKLSTENKEKENSRILSQELKEILPALIQIQNQTFDNERTNGNYNKSICTQSFLQLSILFI